MVPILVVWVVVLVRIFLISSPGPDFIYLESGSGFYRCSPGPGPDLSVVGPGPDFIHCESGFCSGPAPESVRF